MFRQLTAIITVFITSFVLFVSPVRAESLPVNSVNYNQVSSSYSNKKEIVNTVEDIIHTVSDATEIVIGGGTIICVAGSLASSTIFPPAAALLPYCPAIGVAGGVEVVKTIKPAKALRILKYAF